MKIHKIALLAAATLLAGCIKMEQDLVLNADGTGALHMRYGMKEDAIAQIEAMAKDSALSGQTNTQSSLPFHFTEQQVRKDFAVYAQDGVTLESYKSDVVDGWKFVELGMKFQTLAGLMKTEFLADRKLTLRRETGGRYILEQKPDSPHVPEQNADNPAVQEMMASLMKGFHAGISVQVPGDVMESNGSVTGRVVSWVFDLESDPQALKKAQKLNMRVVFSGDGVTLPEAGGSASSKH